MKAEYIFNLFMMAPPRKEPIDVTQNDNLMVELVAKLKNRNGTAFLPPEGAVANFIAVKPDGHGIVLRSDDPEEPKVTLADDEVRVSLPREALAVTGWIACKIAIQDNEAIASAQEFSLMCNRDLLPEDFTESEAYQSIIYYLQHLGEREAEFDDMKEQFYQAINGLTEDDEVINARIDGPYSTTYDTLKLRLDHMSGLLMLKGNASDLENTKLKVVRLEQEVKRYKELYEQSNPTQSPRVSSEGYGVVSLPKNAGQGPMDVKVEGLTLQNELDTRNTSGTYRVKSVGKNLAKINKQGNLWEITDDRIRNLKQNSNAILCKVLLPTGTYTVNIKLFTKPSTSTSLTCKLDDVGMPSYNFTDFQTYAIGSTVRKTITIAQDTMVEYTMWGNANSEKFEFQFWISKDAITPYEPYTESTQYITAKHNDGTIAELRSLPNGTKDEIDVVGRKVIIRTGKVTFNGNENWTLASENEERYIFRISDWTIDNNSVVFHRYQNRSAAIATNGKNRIIVESTWNLIDWDLEGDIGISAQTHLVLIFKANLGITTVQQLKQYLNQYPVQLIYQLAEPLEIPIQVSGSLHSYPSGTVYVEPAIADVGVYSGGVSILNTDYPIHQLESISKIDFNSGLPTEIDTSTAVIAPDGLTFTHSALSNGDIVFFTYLYDDSIYTAGKATCEYYDSRFVLKDDVTGKFYRKVETVEDGELVTQLVEV